MWREFRLVGLLIVKRLRRQKYDPVIMEIICALPLIGHIAKRYKYYMTKIYDELNFGRPRAPDCR